MNNEPLVCSQCGSDEVEQLMWVNPNTNEIGGVLSDPLERDDCWCKKCEDKYKLITQSEFEKQHNA